MELINKKFNKLTIIEEFSLVKNNRSRRYLKCKCECGNIAIIQKDKVINGHTKSCGCIREKSRRTLGHRTNKIERGRANFNEVYGAYKKGAKNRGYDFELTKEQFEEVITKPCIYCGEEKRVHYHKQYSNGAFEYTGLDRYDNSKGYTIDNVVSCCSICNRMKSNMDAKEFEEKIDQISARKDMWKRTG